MSGQIDLPPKYTENIGHLVNSSPGNFIYFLSHSYFKYSYFSYLFSCNGNFFYIKNENGALWNRLLVGIVCAEELKEGKKNVKKWVKLELKKEFDPFSVFSHLQLSVFTPPLHSIEDNKCLEE